MTCIEPDSPLPVGRGGGGNGWFSLGGIESHLNLWAPGGGLGAGDTAAGVEREVRTSRSGGLF